jgi:hypothetical protein
MEAISPRIVDLAPTILRLFGLGIPDYMDGKDLGIQKQVRKTSKGK